MAESTGCCCKCCLRLIISIGVLSLIVWLTLRADTPKCSIRYFYLSALNKTLNTPKNGTSTLFFDLRLQNTNKDKGVYYDPLNLTFYDNPNRSHIIGNCTIPPFYQGHQKKTNRTKSVEVNNTLVLGSGFTTGPPVFRVELATAVRFKNIFWKWKSKRRMLVVEADVEVNDNQGVKVSKKDIKLKSGASEKGYCGRAQVGVWLGLMVLVLLNFR